MGEKHVRAQHKTGIESTLEITEPYSAGESKMVLGKLVLEMQTEEQRTVPWTEGRRCGRGRTAAAVHQGQLRKFTKSDWRSEHQRGRRSKYLESFILCSLHSWENQASDLLCCFLSSQEQGRILREPLNALSFHFFFLTCVCARVHTHAHTLEGGIT